jgi:hypothetical protein
VVCASCSEEPESGAPPLEGTGSVDASVDASNDLGQVTVTVVSPGETAEATSAGTTALSGGDDNGCAALEASYAAALVDATVCDFFAVGPTCQQLADSSLSCPGCNVSVQDPTRLVMLRKGWEASGCDARGRNCPAIVCANLSRGLCVPRGASAVCEGTTAIMTAP